MTKLVCSRSNQQNFLLEIEHRSMRERNANSPKLELPQFHNFPPHKYFLEK